MRPVLLIFGMCLAFACQEQKPSEVLTGQWHALSLQVSDSIWQVQVDPIQLTFFSDQRYHLDWYGGQSENGQFHINGDWLHIQSTEMADRKLRIMHMDVDSLLLSGTLHDRRTVIGFRKTKQTPLSE